jgi:hypothetical protein
MPSRFWKASGNALLPSRNIFVTAAAFTPASLSPKVWIEADPTKLYTDAGTTLVSADGQAVQQANDKSGNGVNMSQATLANRPLYKTGSGHPYLLFDGTNDSIEDNGTSHAYGDGSGQMWLAVCVYQAATTGWQWAALLRDATDGTSQLRIESSSGTIRGYTDEGGSSGELVLGTATVGVQYVVFLQLTTTQLAAYLNNGTPVTASLSSLVTHNATMHIGYQPFANSNYWNGGIKAVITGAGVLSSTDRTNLYNYLAAL